MSAPTVREIDPSCLDDLRSLATAYADLFVTAFPDPDERESLENIIEALRLKAEGWYGENSYHVLVAEQDGHVTGAVIADYLAVPNAGVVEFLVVDPNWRCGGVGGRLLAAAEDAMAAAAAVRGRALDLVVAEIDDPAMVGPDQSTAMDPVERCLVWDHWGYRRLTFRYIQPALSPGGQPVTCLLLMAKAISSRFDDQLPADYVITLVGEYLRWAMRIRDPASHDVFRAMAAELSRASDVKLQRVFS
jgi:GNAT superfamily N-acetyltransferase